MLKHILLALGLAAFAPAPAQALCIYHGVFSARTTLEREFRDARWVVRARVVSADYHWSDEDDSWTVYKLRLVESFKGKLTQRFTFFTRRDSGGFYMDGNGAVPDLGRDYLLFLVPSPFPRSSPPEARQALWVNYNCGRSKPWSELTAAEAGKLRALSARR
jgi:hypothetical protein